MRDRSSSVKPKGKSEGKHEGKPEGKPDDGEDQIRSTVLFDLWLAARAAIALLDDALAGTGLDAEDFAIYSVLRQGGAISPSELARWMSAPATTVSSHVKRLEGRGHVRKARNPTDGRSYRLELTASGRRAWATAGQRFNVALAGVESALAIPADQVHHVLAVLREAIATAGAATPD